MCYCVKQQLTKLTFSPSDVMADWSIVCSFLHLISCRQFSTIQPLEQFNNVCCGIRFLEHVVFTFNMNFTDRSELEAEVTSPSGVKSLLIRPRGRFDEDEKEVYNLSVLSLHFWGEQPGGKWKVVFRDGKNSTFDSGKYTGLFKVSKTPKRPSANYIMAHSLRLKS